MEIGKMDKKKALKIFLTVCRILVGVVFIFSGFVKGIDPLGTTYKLIDYFDAFQIGFLSPLSLSFSILLNMSEFILGIALVLGAFPRIFIWVASIYMAIFTPLTFVLAIYNPVTDCGCFGDAIVLTNWQTFFKNIIIVAFLLPVFLARKNIQSRLTFKSQWLLILLASVGFLFISAKTYRHLPFIDFRPYKIGTYIPDDMKIPKGVVTDSFRYSLVYQKGEILKEFDIDAIPYEDTTWKWVETKSELVRKGYHPPIHDFSFTNLQGENITDSILYDTSYVFLVISHKIKKASLTGLTKLNPIYKFSELEGYKFYMATSSVGKDIETIKNKIELPYNFYIADDIMLKTVIRANPGLVLIKNGTIINKWHNNDFPSSEELSSIIEQYKN